MLEHIFRNLYDIRVFDLMTEFDENDSIETEDILKLLEYGETERIQIKDSIEHLVKEHILKIKQIEAEASTGCKICKFTDNMLIPRFGSHKKHTPEKIKMVKMDSYYMDNNDITKALKSAVFAHISLITEKFIQESNNEKE